MAEGAEALGQIEVHVLVACEEAFGEVLRYADGVGEVQGGSAHRGEDEFAHQPAGVLDDDAAVRGGAAQLGDVFLEGGGGASARFFGVLNQGHDQLALGCFDAYACADFEVGAFKPTAVYR